MILNKQFIALNNGEGKSSGYIGDASIKNSLKLQQNMAGPNDCDTVRAKVVNATTSERIASPKPYLGTLIVQENGWSCLGLKQRAERDGA